MEAVLSDHLDDHSTQLASKTKGLLQSKLTEVLASETVASAKESLEAVLNESLKSSFLQFVCLRSR
jgi:hypothetical protein